MFTVGFSTQTMAICRHWKKGFCSQGSHCGFQHPQTEPPSGYPSQQTMPPPRFPLPQLVPAMREVERHNAAPHPGRLALEAASTRHQVQLPKLVIANPMAGSVKRRRCEEMSFSMPVSAPAGAWRGHEVWSGCLDPDGLPIGRAPSSPLPRSELSLPTYDFHPFSPVARRASRPTAKMGAQKRMSNGETKTLVGPHPSTIRVSAQYQTQAAIERKLQQPGVDLQERSIAEAKENSLRLQGVQWLDVVRRALQLPVRTFTTACTYFHKFRLAHPSGTPTGDSYLWSDAAAASLFTACKMEDTLKKSRDILAASYNLKAASAHDHLPSDDPMFEQQSRMVIGLERMVLEASTFDFRSRAPHHTLTKIAKTLGGADEVKSVHDLAWTALTDIYRTFAPLKQTSVTLALAMLELAARLTNAEIVLEKLKQYDLEKVNTSREEIMETMLDSLDLYVQHTTASTLGTRFSLDDFLRLRLALNKECEDNTIVRHCTAPAQVTSATKVQNGHPTPVSPPQNGSGNPPQPPIVLQHAPPVAGGTLRFMLNPQLAHDEREQVDSYFKEEWEEYEEEIEVPLPRTERRPGPPSSRASSRDRRSDDRRDERDRLPPRPYDDRRERERARVDRERGYDRDRRPAPRDRRYDDDRRRYDDRDYKRYDDRRYDDRRPRDDRPPRDDRTPRDDRPPRDERPLRDDRSYDERRFPRDARR